MKYIRTKDGIYDYEPVGNVDVDGFIVQHIAGWDKPIMKEDILKIAGTIEELCDVIIFKTNDYRDVKGQLKLVDLRIAVGTKEDSRNYLVNQMRSELFEFAYLGIETDKGLIYIAKMNEKGELELL